MKGPGFDGTKVVTFVVIYEGYPEGEFWLTVEEDQGVVFNIIYKFVVAHALTYYLMLFL